MSGRHDGRRPPRTPSAGMPSTSGPAARPPDASAGKDLSERDLGRRRALAAWGWVNEAEQLAKRDRYGTLARKLPSYLQVSGLGQTLAFLYGRGFARGKPDEQSAEGLLLKQIGAYLQDFCKRPRVVDPMETLLSLRPAEYRAATRELVAIAEWLKRFAEGRLGEEDEGQA